MAVTPHVFPQAVQRLLADKSMDLNTDSLKVMLLSAYTWSNAHSTITAVKAAGTEATGTGYTAGGATLAGVTVATSGLVTTLDCNDVTWTTSTVSAAHAVFYDAQGGTDATNYPLVHWDLGGTQSTTAGTFSLTISGSGLLTVTSS